MPRRKSVIVHESSSPRISSSFAGAPIAVAMNETRKSVLVATGAAASRRLAVAARRTFARDVLLALRLRVHRIDVRLHRRIGEVLAPILRDDSARFQGENGGEEQEEKRK